MPNISFINIHIFQKKTTSDLNSFDVSHTLEKCFGHFDYLIGEAFCPFQSNFSFVATSPQLEGTFTTGILYHVRARLTSKVQFV